MDSEGHVMLMQQGEGGVTLLAHYDTLEQRFLSFQAWSAIKHPMIQEVNRRWEEFLALAQLTLRLATFVIPKKGDRETFDSVIVKLNI